MLAHIYHSNHHHFLCFVCLLRLFCLSLEACSTRYVTLVWNFVICTELICLWNVVRFQQTFESLALVIPLSIKYFLIICSRCIGQLLACSILYATLWYEIFCYLFISSTWRRCKIKTWNLGTAASTQIVLNFLVLASFPVGFIFSMMVCCMSMKLHKQEWHCCWNVTFFLW